MTNALIFIEDSYICLFQTEESLNELQRSIHPLYTEKMMSLIQNHKDALDKAQDEL